MQLIKRTFVQIALIFAFLKSAEATVCQCQLRNPPPGQAIIDIIQTRDCCRIIDPSGGIPTVLGCSTAEPAEDIRDAFADCCNDAGQVGGCLA